MTDEIKKALLLAADALDVVGDWTDMTDVQIDPPKEWGLEAHYELAEEGWCAITELARKLRELAGGNDNGNADE